MKTAVVSLLALVFGVVIGLSSLPALASSAGSAAQDSVKNMQCLKRTNPKTNVETTSVFSKPIDGNWSSRKGVVIHSNHNEVAACRDQQDADCNVEIFDTFYLKRIDKSDVYKYVRKYFGIKNPDEIVEEMKLGHNGLYLQGKVSWSGSKRGEIFVLYDGKGNCPFTGQSDCNLYTLEIYPDGSGWDAYKPSHAKSWKQCFSGMQPGGGGGHDPPP